MQQFFYTDKNFVSEAVAYLYATIASVLSEKDTVNVAVSGGSTPLPIYELLFKRDIDWTRVNVYLVDERCVPSENSNSNFGNILRIANEKINLHQLYFTELGNEMSAEKYAQLLPTKPFDLILLGLGEDGHTASLFPNSKALNETHKSVVYNKVQDKFPHRITLTFPVLLNAEKLIVLAKGEKKKKIISEINNGAENFPMTRVAREARFLQWILD